MREYGVSKYLHSGLKNADAQSSGSQSITATRGYDAFGNVESSSGSWTGAFGYGGPYGYQSAGEGGLMLLGHRYYDPSTGRFLTRDPIKDGRNWYAYGAGDLAPTLFADDSGLALIYIATNPVGPGNHAFAIVVDESTGETWSIGGGPRGGSLVNKSGPAGIGNYEGLRVGGPIPANAILIRDDRLPGQYWFDKMNRIGSEIEAVKWSYLWSWLNSNAFLTTVVTRAGLMDEIRRAPQMNDLDSRFGAMLPGGRRWVPGWGVLLPR